MNSFLKIPQFVSEDEEREFWETADTSLFFDLENPVELNVTQLKPTTKLSYKN